jgi:hypothetical protein
MRSKNDIMMKRKEDEKSRVAVERQSYIDDDNLTGDGEGGGSVGQNCGHGPSRLS